MIGTVTDVDGNEHDGMRPRMNAAYCYRHFNAQLGLNCGTRWKDKWEIRKYPIEYESWYKIKEFIVLSKTKLEIGFLILQIDDPANKGHKGLS